MAPLVTNNIISSDMNLFFALLIGIAFGFVLEASGFSSSRKLAGMFYGYDTTVLKVFFTAAITAMLGTLFMSLFGWLDLNVIYINSLYLDSTIFGGIVMGIGFIMGGFCPGTAFCAISIGKIDAMVFAIGLFVGVFLFVEFYDYISVLHNANYMGEIKLSDFLGLKDGFVCLIIVCVAFIMFYLGDLAEAKFPLKNK
ncbi:MAG: YeeE/YedE family protein [Marinifilaceae bacterium]|jgi:hypothetical protein|nr:YeeE/YedE family protein [Marinifilaceae bacterium]